MILRTSKTSPFGRKVKIAAAILGLADRIEIVAADPWNDADTLRSQNPLGKMPVLIADDGAAVYDSGVILEYLDGLAPTPALFPAEKRARLRTLTFHALGDGVIEAGLLVTYETKRRPTEFCYQPFVEHQRGKIRRALDALAQDAPDPQNPDAGAIAVACALGYLDWRKQVDWRATHAPLVAWLDAFSARAPAFAATRAEPDH